MVCHFKSKIQLWDLSLIFSVDHQITGVDGANMICRRHSERARKSTKNNNVLIKFFFFYTIHSILRICCVVGCN